MSRLRLDYLRLSNAATELPRHGLPVQQQMEFGSLVTLSAERTRLLESKILVTSRKSCSIRACR